jgi:hypothetical protein
MSPKKGSPPKGALRRLVHSGKDSSSEDIYKSPVTIAFSAPIRFTPQNKQIATKTGSLEDIAEMHKYFILRYVIEI